MAPSRSPLLLSAAASRLLIVDMQEKLLPVIPEREEILKQCLKLVSAAEILRVPVSCTEQYPAGLGGTVADLASRLPDRPAKLRFSCAECLDWAATAQNSAGRPQVVLAGIEAHVCVLQTALDLQAAGFQVAVAADAIGSRKDRDREIAFRRLSDAGVTLVTTEMVLFEWCEVAGTPEFKQISRLVREVPPPRS